MPSTEMRRISLAKMWLNLISLKTVKCSPLGAISRENVTVEGIVVIFYGYICVVPSGKCCRIQCYINVSLSCDIQQCTIGIKG